jgi:phosphoribosyl-ATP pyrophosphohydrolase
MSADQSVLQKLMDVIVDRKRQRPAGSYTVTLLDGGADAIGAKIREEADELIEAARGADRDRRPAVIHEAADLVYHVLVMLGHCDVTLAEVEKELARRFGTSGLEEKASRLGEKSP